MRTLITILLLVPALAFAKPAPKAKPAPQDTVGFGSLGGKTPPSDMSAVDQLKLKLLDAEDQRDKLQELLIRTNAQLNQCSNVLAGQGLQKLQADKTSRDKEREELAKKYHKGK